MNFVGHLLYFYLRMSGIYSKMHTFYFRGADAKNLFCLTYTYLFFVSDVDECAENNGGCHINGDCYNTPGSFCCVCKDGYYGNGFSCTGKILITPPPVGGRGIVFGRFFFLSFFLSLSATLRENGWTDLHEIFREGVE